MRALSAELEAAQKQASSRPYVQCLVNDYRGDRARQRFQRYYTGAEPEGFVAAVGAPDGSLVRADQRCPCGSGKRYKACHGVRGGWHRYP